MLGVNLLEVHVTQSSQDLEHDPSPPGSSRIHHHVACDFERTDSLALIVEREDKSRTILAAASKELLSCFA
jgi:hypothetical protein